MEAGQRDTLDEAIAPWTRTELPESGGSQQERPFPQPPASLGQGLAELGDLADCTGEGRPESRLGHAGSRPGVEMPRVG